MVIWRCMTDMKLKLNRRGYVFPDDVRDVAMDVLRHRVALTYEAEANNLTSEEVVAEILNAVKVP